MPKTYQRLVKTTPKPRATKKSNGELVGPLLFCASALLVAAGGTTDVDDITVRDVPCVDAGHGVDSVRAI
jgi:hypothetical protein